MQFCNAPCDGKAETVAGERARFVGAVEFVENMLRIFERYRFAAVGNMNDGFRVFRDDLNSDLSVLRRIFDCVVEQIDPYLLQKLPVADSVNLFAVECDIVFSFACINFLPLVFGYDFVWYTVTVSEFICMIIAMVLRRISEKNGIVYR